MKRTVAKDTEFRSQKLHDTDIQGRDQAVTVTGEVPPQHNIAGSLRLNEHAGLADIDHAFTSGADDPAALRYRGALRRCR